MSRPRLSMPPAFRPARRHVRGFKCIIAAIVLPAYLSACSFWATASLTELAVKPAKKIRVMVDDGFRVQLEDAQVVDGDVEGTVTKVETVVELRPDLIGPYAGQSIVILGEEIQTIERRKRDVPATTVVVLMVVVPLIFVAGVVVWGLTGCGSWC